VTERAIIKLIEEGTSPPFLIRGYKLLLTIGNLNAGGEMKRLDDHGKAALVGSEKAICKEEFEQICREAARRSTCTAAYIRAVLARTRIFTGSSEKAASLAADIDVANVQVAVVTLYLLLEEKCEDDFDVAEVLNSHEPGPVGE